MNGWSIFLVIYILLLISGIGLAILYKRYKVEHEKKQFNKFMKLRAFLYSQIETLAKAYDELLEKCEGYVLTLEGNQEEQAEPNLKETLTLIKDVETNLVIVKTELNDLAIPTDLREARDLLLAIINRLNKQIFKMLGAKGAENLLGAIEADEFRENAEDFKSVNSIIKKFMNKHGIDEKDYFYQGKQLYV